MVDGGRMKEIVEILNDNGYIFKSFLEIDKKALSTRKKIQVFEGVNLSGFYIAVFIVYAGGGFLKKNADEIEVLYKRLKNFKDHDFKKKICLINHKASKEAANLMKKRGWRIIGAAV